jgi:hypothetical protein
MPRPGANVLRLLVLITAATGAYAQVQLGVVRLGHALDESVAGLRPVIGTPGSAYLGPVLPLPFPIKQAAVRGDAALAIAGAESEPLMAYRLTGFRGDVLTHHAIAPADRLWLNDAGSLALLQSGNELRLVTGLPDGSEPGPPVIVDGLTAVTFLQDDQRCALIASTADGATRLDTLCADRPGELTWLRTLDNTTTNAIAHTTGNGLFLTDTTSRAILLLPNPIATSPVQAAATDIDDPLALVAISRSEVLAARKGVAHLLLLTAAGANTTIELPAAPDRLYLLTESRLVACTGSGDDDPLLVIDLLQDRTPFFIPILRSLP